MATHSSALAWKIPWTGECGGLQYMGSQRVGHDWVTSLSLFTFMHWRRKWQPTPVFLPGESQGLGSLVGCHLWGHTELDTTEATEANGYRRESKSPWQRTPILSWKPGLSQVTSRSCWDEAPQPGLASLHQCGSHPVTSTCRAFEHLKNSPEGADHAPSKERERALQMIPWARITMYQPVRIISDRRYHPFDWLPHIHHSQPQLIITSRALVDFFHRISATFSDQDHVSTHSTWTHCLFMMLWSSPVSFFARGMKTPAP